MWRRRRWRTGNWGSKLGTRKRVTQEHKATRAICVAFARDPEIGKLRKRDGREPALSEAEGAPVTPLDGPRERTISGEFSKERAMTQKIIEVVGTSKDSFAKAAENAVAEAAKTVRGIKWAHVDSLDMQLDGAKVLLYRATTKIYFDVEH